MNYCLDTCFLIDLQRETKRRRGTAFEFLANNSSANLWISSITWGEFAEGRRAENSEEVRQVRSAFEIASVSEEIAEIYAETSRSLRAKGRLIDTNDIWIAATAISLQFPLVTKNLIDFRRIPHLELITY